MPYEQLLVFVYSGLGTFSKSCSVWSSNSRFIMYLTFIVWTGKMRIKNSYVWEGFVTLSEKLLWMNMNKENEDFTPLYTTLLL